MADGIPEMAFLNVTGLIFFFSFFPLFFIWIGTDSFLWLEVLSCKFPVCSKSSGTFRLSVLENCRMQPCPWNERSFGQSGFPECFVHVLARCWRGGRMELGLQNPQIPPPAPLRTCCEPPTGHSTPSVLSSVAGDDLSIFLGEQSKILHSRHWQGQDWVLFPKKQPLPGVTLQLLGLHRAHYPSPSLAPQLPT